MSEFIDISLPLSSSIPVWPGSQAFRLEPVRRMANGDQHNESAISTNIHTGTHIDAPWHFLSDGAKTDALAVDLLIGPAQVVDIPGVRQITSEVLESLDITKRTERLLFRTDNSALWNQGETNFKKDFVALTADAATWLVEVGIKLVGIDYLSIQLFDDNAPTHEILLQAEVVILEGLNLWEVTPGSYELFCLPLSICGAEGAPARAVLRR